MSEAKFTPGPWHMGGAPSLKIWDRHKQEVVTECWHIGGNVGEANARLISAAPDMFEALENLLKAYEDLKRDVIDGYEDPYPEASASARAALAKSQG